MQWSFSESNIFTRFTFCADVYVPTIVFFSQIVSLFSLSALPSLNSLWVLVFGYKLLSETVILISHLKCFFNLNLKMSHQIPNVKFRPFKFVSYILFTYVI